MTYKSGTKNRSVIARFVPESEPFPRCKKVVKTVVKLLLLMYYIWDIHAAPLGYITLFPSQQVFPLCP